MSGGPLSAIIKYSLFDCLQIVRLPDTHLIRKLPSIYADGVKFWLTNTDGKEALD